ncbi:MAG: porin [Holophagaceae bacterium]
MTRTTLNRTLGLAALAVIAAAPASAQAPKISGLLQVWYSQMLDSNLRLNAKEPGGYFNLRSEFQENTFSIRRSEIKVAGSITDDIDYEVMMDPSINTSASNPSILQDAAITWKLGSGFDLKVGQFKNLQTMEGLTSSGEILFAERAQLARQFGDKRDRGAALSYGSGDPKEFAWKGTVALFNGMGDAVSGKGNDANAQKDLVLRADFTLAKNHKFGAYTLQGATDQADKGALAAKTFAGAAGAVPSAASILDAKDKTTNLGAYYAFQNDVWYFAGEVMTGQLGRRYPSVGAAGAASRQHLDQKFMGTWLTGGYTTGSHTFLLRYDTANYNQGDDWYTAYNPYTQSAPGVSTGTDYTPKFTEITAGYLYAFKPEKIKAANLKVNYIARSKNFLKPRAGQTGEQGGDTLLVALQVAF